MIGKSAGKLILFVVMIVFIMIYLGLEGKGLMIIRILLGVLVGASLGFFFAKESISQKANDTENMPRWILRLAGKPMNAHWLPLEIWSILLGIFGPLIFLAYLISTGESWSELSLPISVLLTWILTVCYLICYFRRK